MSSKSEAKRLIEQRAVRINDQVVNQWDYRDKKGDVIKIGPRNIQKNTNKKPTPLKRVGFYFTLLLPLP